MSSKRHLNITIDDDVYLHYRVFKKDVNISDLVNNYLRFMMKTREENKETLLLEKELEDLKEEQVKASERAAAILLELNNRKAEAEKLSKEELAKAMVMHDTVRNSDFLRSLD